MMNFYETFVEFMRNTIGARISNGDKWLVLHSASPISWVVYEKKSFAKKTTMLYNGGNIDVALTYLGDSYSGE